MSSRSLKSPLETQISVDFLREQIENYFDTIGRTLGIVKPGEEITDVKIQFTGMLPVTLTIKKRVEGRTIIHGP